MYLIVLLELLFQVGEIFFDLLDPGPALRFLFLVGHRERGVRQVP